ncbi:MAG TPA: MurR/RpiR family transcriptional regulator [Polaromonas sp.]|uniref:MurR/RpiR family transcriptional regulator n=1 Tax=Polaromonas sp. TaxID=1869339 RepID=UPI002D3C320F|nr:MurR/RpiR family transcriptional regulator [Polaromonas sp.]HYW58434.1 MurR/RpiR family transcriptional regulator [Polaromonas sp.]
MKKPFQVKTPSPVRPAAPPELAFAQSPLGARLRTVLSDPLATPGNRATADFLLRNPVRATAWGIEELAANAHTSTATLSRFARTLGMSGFSALRAEMAEVLQGVLQPVEKLRGVVAREDGTLSVVSESLALTLGNARTTAEGLDPERLAELARRLAKASTVYIMGFGLSSHLAAMLALDLQPFCPQLVNVVEFGGTEVAAGRLMNIGKTDVLIAISFPRYADDAIRLTQYARDRGAYTLAITDSMASPLAAVADEGLFANSTHPVLSSSSVSALLVIEALVTSLMISNGDHVQQAARLTEAISAYMFSPEKGRKR